VEERAAEEGSRRVSKGFGANKGYLCERPLCHRRLGLRRCELEGACVFFVARWFMDVSCKLRKGLKFLLRISMEINQMPSVSANAFSSLIINTIRLYKK